MLKFALNLDKRERFYKIYTLIMRLNRKFFNRKTLVVAKEILGKYLCRRINDKTIRSKITEVEAYCGPQDRASHASKGVTPRTKIMFGPPGYAYIYMIYGMYHCLNIITEKEGYPAAVLIRALDIENGKGPGRLCRKFKIDKKLNGMDLVKSKKLWLEDLGAIIKPSQIKKGKRIGVDYAGKWKERLWRFYSV